MIRHLLLALALLAPQLPSPARPSREDRVFACIRRLESGGNYRAVGRGRARGHYGAYQFSPATWRSVGGIGNPASAAPAEQDRLARVLLRRSGWGQWATYSLCSGA